MRPIALMLCALITQAALGEDYFQTLDRRLSDLQRRAIDAALLDRAARALIGGADLTVVGDPGVAADLVGGAGAFAFSTLDPPRAGDVVLLLEGLPAPPDTVALPLPDDPDPAVRLAAAWAVQLELFAACTRLGETPVVRQSLEIDTRRDRFFRYGGQRFHHDLWLEPIPAHTLAPRYLAAVRRVLRDLATASGDALDRAAFRIDDTLADGGVVRLRPAGRALPHHVLGLPFPVLADDAARPGPRDLVLAIGGYAHPGSEYWGEEDFRDAGRGVIWAVNAYDTYPHDLRRGEFVIDLMGPVGDCVVKVEHYDARLGPVSSVTAAAVAHHLAYHRPR